MYRRTELEEYQDNWTEAERDLAINIFNFFSWGNEDLGSILNPTDKPVQEEDPNTVPKEVAPYKKQPLPA